LNIAIILAGGSGERMGAGIPKQFIEVLGKPVIAYTLDKFQEHEEIDAIEIACVEAHIPLMNEIVSKYNFFKVKWIIKGGDTPEETVINAISNLTDICSEDDIVSIHFAVNPFVSSELITDGLRVCRERGNAISTTPFFLHSGMRTTDEYSAEYISRKSLVCMNTPHTFKYGLIQKLYKDAKEQNNLGYPDPHTPQLMYAMGLPIYFSKGSQTNIKLTTQEDLDLFVGYTLGCKHRQLGWG
jgi:2-C-methyl-D-erythritol 4-phosphate cytidylyltransferase